MAQPTRMQFLRPFTTRLFNPLSRRFAGHLPWFGILKYTGRRTGRRYETPINVFRRGDTWILALTYGSDVQWVKNVVASGGCELVTRGRTVRLVDPEIFVDPRQRQVPALVRAILRVNRVTEFLSLRAAPAM